MGKELQQPQHEKNTAVFTGNLLAGRFRITRPLGQGGMGEVWLAEDEQLDGELVACKVLKSDLKSNPQALTDLKREVLVMRKLRHKNILPVHNFWNADGHSFITMEYVEGENLASQLAERDRPFLLGEALPWIGDLASALDFAHAQGVLHRDVKPANILQCADGQVQLADFGIARTVAEAESKNRGLYTQGTLYYMSPEQLANTALDHRADLYSFACTLYELLSGSPPFIGHDIPAQIELTPPEALSFLGQVSSDAIIRGLSKNPEDRQSTCTQLCQEIAAGYSDDYDAPDMPEGTPRDDADTSLSLEIDLETRRSRLGRVLLQYNIISQNDLAEALLDQQKHGERLGATLIRMGILTDEGLRDALAHQLNIDIITPQKEPFDLELVHRYPESDARTNSCIPVRKIKGAVLVAISDPLDGAATASLEKVYGKTLTLRVATPDQVTQAIDLHYAN